jgi:hypothetical protein
MEEWRPAIESSTVSYQKVKVLDQLGIIEADLEDDLKQLF